MSTVRTDGPGYTPVTADYAYEPHRDVKTQVLNRAGARTISQYDYRYNSIGNRTSVVNTGEAFAGREGFNLYGYNSRSEVTESKRYRGSDINDTSQPVYPEYRSYNYDPIGNRETAVDGNETSETGKSTTYTTNGLNQYDSTAVTPNNNESTTFTYDADGNMTSVADSTGYTLYVFDGENRLIEVRPETPQANQKKVAFAYDFMGRRISKSVSSWNNGAWTSLSSRTFTWDGWLMTDETLTTGTAQPETTSYVWGLDLSQTITGAGGVGGLLSMTDDTDSNFNCYIYDANGNVAQLFNFNTYQFASQYEYDSNGNMLLSNKYASEDNPFKFSNKYFDLEIVMYYYGYRYYNIKFGRWINRDIIEENGGVNLYNFINNNYINFFDYLGQKQYGLVGPVEIINMLPGIARAKKWNYLAKFFEKWASAPQFIISDQRYPKANDPYVDVDTITMDWVRGFDKGRKAYDYLSKPSMYSTPNAINEIKKKIRYPEFVEDIGGYKQFGHNWNRYIRTSIHCWYIQSTKILADPLYHTIWYGPNNVNELEATLHSFNMYSFVAGHICGKKIYIDGVGIYIKDSFSFTEDGQELGAWDDDTFDEKNPNRVNRITGFRVNNGTFRQYRKFTGKGGDFWIFSDIKRVWFNAPIEISL